MLYNRRGLALAASAGWMDPGRVPSFSYDVACPIYLDELGLGGFEPKTAAKETKHCRGHQDKSVSASARGAGQDWFVAVFRVTLPLSVRLRNETISAEYA